MEVAVNHDTHDSSSSLHSRPKEFIIAVKISPIPIPIPSIAIHLYALYLVKEVSVSQLELCIFRELDLSSLRQDTVQDAQKKIN